MTFRRPTIVLAVAAFVILSVAPTAQADSSIFGGFNFPTGDFDQAAKTGWTMGGYATGNVIPLVQIGALIAYNDFVTSTEIYEVGATFGSSLNAWEFEALGQVDVFFLKAYLGLGFANYKGLTEEGDTGRKNDFAWQVGAAFQFFFLEGRLSYHQINASNVTPNWVSMTAGILF